MRFERRGVVAAALMALVAAGVVALALWVLTPSVPERRRPTPPPTETVTESVEPSAPRPLSRDPRTGRGGRPETQPGEHAPPRERPLPPYLAPIADELGPDGPQTSPEAAKTPEGRAAAGLQVAWNDIAQGMSDKANYVPDATQLEGEAFGLVDDYRKLRRGESVDWAELQRKQQQLLDRIDATDGLTDENSAYEDGLRKLRLKLEAYEADKRASKR
jgi:hypothetical protein